jgi:hypothetical protein
MTKEERRAEQRMRAHRSQTFRRRLRRENPDLIADSSDLLRLEDAMRGSEPLRAALFRLIDKEATSVS